MDYLCMHYSHNIDIKKKQNQNQQVVATPMAKRRKSRYSEPRAVHTMYIALKVRKSRYRRKFPDGRTYSRDYGH